jgi:lon-related putative ATP-dependent protease
MVNPLPPEKLRWRCDLSELKFDTTEELATFPTILGQDRAVHALQTGLEMDYPGFNIFVSGATGTGRNTTVKFLLEKMQDHRHPIVDICCVNNFKSPDLPIIITFPAGQGTSFRKSMDSLIMELRAAIPKLFDTEKFKKQQEALAEKYDLQQRKLIEDFESLAQKSNFTIVQIQVGPYAKPDVLPIIDNQPIPLENVLVMAKEGKIPEDEKNKIIARHEELSKELAKVLKESLKLQRDKEKNLAKLDHDTIRPVIGELIHELKETYKDKKVAVYLTAVQGSLIANHHLFDGRDEKGEQRERRRDRMASDPFLEYKVNVLVDNSEQKGSPVLFENTPSYSKLFGTIERVMDGSGQWRTDFTKIRAGSLLRANGGYLVLHAMDVLIEAGVWNSLKRTLKSRTIEIQGYDPIFLLAPLSLKPEPIDIDVKVIMVGDPNIYQILLQMDPDFEKIFKIKAEFDSVMKNSSENLLKYAEFTKRLCDEEKLLPFNKSAVAAVVEFGVRQAGRNNKISTRFNQVADVLREASFYARKQKAKLVREAHVDMAIQNAIERVNMIEEKIQEMIEEDIIIIDVQGSIVGQVNGLSVIDTGDYMFGRPSRITAQTAMGRSGIINIEREAELSGPTHNKGVLIISGYMQGKFAQDKPLAVNASLCFEQSYSGVDGDSASSTEIYALLSRLADVPIRQDIAVTGSVNQNGDIQPIGGVNEKIEGFFQVCKAKGLSGTQGVMIPQRNVDDLMLRKEVVEAAREGLFHIFPVDTIEQGIEILTGIPAGVRNKKGIFPQGSIFYKVNKKLSDFANNYYRIMKVRE